jgi:hypothetical protein
MTTHRPTLLSSALSVFACVVALGTIATTVSQRLAILLAVAAAVPVWGGVELSHREHALAGIALALVGVASGIGAIIYLTTRTAAISPVIEVVPGVVGVYVLALALGPVWPDDERLLLSAGTGLMLLSVILSLAVYETNATGVVVAGIATILAWDLAEQAVNLGEQVGREPRTHWAELVHGTATAGVGVVAGGVVLLFVSIDVTGVPLAGLAGLLGASLMLTLALYN